MKKKHPSYELVMVLDHQTGTLRTDEKKGTEHILGADLFPEIRALLRRCQRNNVRTTLLIQGNANERVLAEIADEHEFAEVVATGKDPGMAVSGRGTRAAEMILVAADRMVRDRAKAAGLTVYPHAVMALWHIEGKGMHLMQFTCGLHELEGLADLLFYSREHIGKGRWDILAALSDAGLLALLERRIPAMRFFFDFTIDDLAVVRLDPKDHGKGSSKVTDVPTERIVRINERSILLALSPTMSIDDLAFHGSHGHNEHLYPSSYLPAALLDFQEYDRHLELIRERFPDGLLETVVFPPLNKCRVTGCPVSPDDFAAITNRYSGASSLDAAGPIVSRHIQHPDNLRTVNALLAELRAMGYCAWTHSFTYNGNTLYNVIADLPGVGYFRCSLLLEKLKVFLLKHQWPDPPPKEIIDLLVDILSESGNDVRLFSSNRWKLTHTIEELLELRPWFPWWRKCYQRAGFGAKIVIVGSHMDSTAGFSSGYHPATDSAPGRDDNGSGMAATLSIARQFIALRGCLRHTVRFCFFNAEEQGLVGSKAYAAFLRSNSAPVKAVICTDMIGFNSDAQRIFEIHAGHSDPAVRDISVPIADRIAAWAAAQGRLAPAQIYKGTSNIETPDRNASDGAIGRSDHAAFHQQGYPAVVVSEDFFANAAGEPGEDPNPNYHRQNDTVIDPAFGADITCAVARAARELAGG